MSLVVERCESVIRVYVGNDDELEMNEVRHHNQPQATVQACTFPTTSNVISGFAQLHFNTVWFSFLNQNVLHDCN